MTSKNDTVLRHFILSVCVGSKGESKNTSLYIKDYDRLTKIHLVHTQVHSEIHGRANFQNILTTIVRTQPRFNENHHPVSTGFALLVESTK